MPYNLFDYHEAMDAEEEDDDKTLWYKKHKSTANETNKEFMDRLDFWKVGDDD